MHTYQTVAGKKFGELSRQLTPIHSEAEQNTRHQSKGIDNFFGLGMGGGGSSLK